MSPPAAGSARALVPLLAAAREAERIARDVAAAQATLAPTAALRHALQQQSRQEALHAGAFSAALAVLPGRAQVPPRLEAVLAAFRRRLLDDVQASRLAASLFGLQHVLEALGHLALQPPDGELARLGDRFVPLRRLLAQQELGHQRLGEVWVPRLGGASPGGWSALRVAGAGYLDLAADAAEAGLHACAAFDAERLHYAQATEACLARLHAALAALPGGRVSA